METNATHRNGMRGCIMQPDGNGFCIFTGDTGAKFTAHISEIVLDGYTPAEVARTRATWASWPAGTNRFAIERGKHSASKAFIVARTVPGSAS